MNYKGTYYLTLKEVKRFLAVWKQTLLAPVISSLMLFIVFSVAFTSRGNNILPPGITFITFLIPGLIMTQVLQNAFSSTASVMIMSKMFGTIADIQMAPLSPNDITLAFIIGSVTRGLATAILIYLSCFILAYFQHGQLIALLHPVWALVFLILSCYIMGAGGLVCGLWAVNFDKVSGIVSMAVLPLTFLSGAFYSIDLLPHFLQTIQWGNPIFLAMDGFRFAFINVAHFGIIYNVVFLALLALILHMVCVYLIRIGYKIRS